MIDSHTHLYFNESFGNDFPGVISRGLEKGVSHFVLPNVDIASIREMRHFHDLFPDITSMAIGLHPTEVKEDWRNSIRVLEKELSTGDYKAIGEIGVDLYWDKGLVRQQLEAFEHQLRMAEEVRFPVIIHSREAFEETIAIINKATPSVPLIFHSFTGSEKDVKMIREVCDPFFGINGVVTYKNAESLRKSLSEIGIEKILLETDSPYLTPVPLRGKRNESSYLDYICNQIGMTLEKTSEEIERITDSNAKEVFRL